MTRDAVLLLLLIAVGAGWLLVHLLLLIRVARAPRLSPALRLLSLLPPAAPIVGWLAEARGLSLLWAAQGIVYCVLRRLAA